MRFFSFFPKIIIRSLSSLHACICIFDSFARSRISFPRPHSFSFFTNVYPGTVYLKYMHVLCRIFIDHLKSYVFRISSECSMRKRTRTHASKYVRTFSACSSPFRGLGRRRRVRLITNRTLALHTANSRLSTGARTSTKEATNVFLFGIMRRASYASFLSDLQEIR